MSGSLAITSRRNPSGSLNAATVSSGERGRGASVGLGSCAEANAPRNCNSDSDRDGQSFVVKNGEQHRRLRWVMTLFTPFAETGKQLETVRTCTRPWAGTPALRQAGMRLPGGALGILSGSPPSLLASA